MPGKASPVPFSGPGKNLGTHHSAMFDMDDADDVKEYSSLRTRNNDRASGIRIERIREVVKTEVDIQAEGRTREEHRTDHFNLFVEWWESKPQVTRGDADEAPKDFSVEYSPIVAEAKPGGTEN